MFAVEPLSILLKIFLQDIGVVGASVIEARMVEARL
jgi:hypothetical protein